MQAAAVEVEANELSPEQHDDLSRSILFGIAPWSKKKERKKKVGSLAAIACNKYGVPWIQLLSIPEKPVRSGGDGWLTALHGSLASFTMALRFRQRDLFHANYQKRYSADCLRDILSLSQPT